MQARYKDATITRASSKLLVWTPRLVSFRSGDSGIARKRKSFIAISQLED